MTRHQVALAVAALVLALSCSGDNPAKPKTGVLLIRPLFPSSAGEEGALLPPPDSLRVEVRDAEGVRVASSGAALPDSGDIALEIVLAPGEGYEVLLQAEGEGDLGRGGIYAARQGGIAITRGTTTEARVSMTEGVPDPPGIAGGAGEPSYTVFWNRVAEADGYVLREYASGSSQDFALPETLRVFSPGLEQGAARLGREGSGPAGPTPRRPAHPARTLRPTTRRTYRVRADLPLGSGIFSDSSWVDLDLWFDLPRVVAVDPADSATEVPDGSAIRIRFDREMDPITLEDTLVVLRERASGTPVSCSRSAEEGNTAVVLTPEDPLERGTWFEVRVSTGVRDLLNRPLDQDPSAEGLQAFVSDFRTEEYDPLRVVEISPADGAADIETETLVVVQFNRAVDAATVSETSFTVSDSAGAVPGTRQVLEGGLSIEFRPSRTLLYDVTHEVVVGTTLLDLRWVW